MTERTERRSQVPGNPVEFILFCELNASERLTKNKLCSKSPLLLVLLQQFGLRGHIIQNSRGRHQCPKNESNTLAANSPVLPATPSSKSSTGTQPMRCSAPGDTQLQHWQGQPCPTFCLQQERPKPFHSSQLPFLRTSQIQLKHEVKNSCNVVRRGVQSPGTQATAGTRVQHVVLGSAMVTAQQAAAASH